MKCLVGFNAFILALLLPVCPLTKAISRFFVYKVIDMEYKIK